MHLYTEIVWVSPNRKESREHFDNNEEPSNERKKGLLEMILITCMTSLINEDK